MKYLFNTSGRNASLDHYSIVGQTTYLLAFSLLVLFLASACEKDTPEPEPEPEPETGLRCVPNLNDILEGQWEMTEGILSGDIYAPGSGVDTVTFAEDGRLSGTGWTAFCNAPPYILVSRTFDGCKYIIERERRVSQDNYQRLPTRVYVIQNYGDDDYMFWSTTASFRDCYTETNAAEFKRIE